MQEEDEESGMHVMWQTPLFLHLYSKKTLFNWMAIVVLMKRI